MCSRIEAERWRSWAEALSRRRARVRWGLKGRRSREKPRVEQASSIRRANAATDAVSPETPAHRTRGDRGFGNAPTPLSCSANGAAPSPAASKASVNVGRSERSTFPRNFRVRCTPSGLTSRKPDTSAARRAWMSRAMASLASAGNVTATKSRSGSGCLELVTQLLQAHVPCGQILQAVAGIGRAGVGRHEDCGIADAPLLQAQRYAPSVAVRVAAVL